MKSLGPGLITGASDDDPSGIATYSQAGARYGFALLWTMVVSYPLMFGIQEVSARIGRVTGKGIAGNLREHYPPYLGFAIVSLLLGANVINLAADIAAMGEAVKLLLGGPALLYAGILTALSLGLQIFIPYKKYVSILRYLTLALFSYVAVVFLVNVDWLAALKNTVVPEIHLETDYLTMIVAVLGTTISPYLFFWEASEEAEEEEDNILSRPLNDAPEQAKSEFHRIDVDNLVGMGFSNIVAIFIMLATAATLHSSGILHIETATQAAEALRPLAGNSSFLLFALGIVGTGLLAIPVLAGSVGFAVGELAKAPIGLDKKPHEAKLFYGVIALATLIGFGLNILDVNPIAALVYAAVINGVVAVPLMILMMFMARNKKVMGAFTLPRWLYVLGWIATLVMLLAALGLFI